MSRVSFDVGRAAFEVIIKIAKRAEAMQPFEMVQSRSDWLMDLSACHANGCPMDFAKLLAADDFNFAHDVFGIRRHINRENGKLMDCFLPRCAWRAELEAIDPDDDAPAPRYESIPHADDPLPAGG